MAQGDSVIGIWNLAMGHLGEDPILSIDDTSKRATACRLAYDAVRRRVLRVYPWNCAEARASLPANATPPPFGYAYAYDLPADFHRFWEQDSPLTNDWSIEGRQVLTDDGAPLNIRYIRDLQDCTVMDAALVDTIALNLALDICMQLTGSAEKRDRIAQNIKDRVPEAHSVDAQENSPREWDEDVWLRARQ